jgi:hypothetical protein
MTLVIPERLRRVIIVQKDVYAKAPVMIELFFSDHIL